MTQDQKPDFRNNNQVSDFLTALLSLIPIISKLDREFAIGAFDEMKIRTLYSHGLNETEKNIGYSEIQKEALGLRAKRYRRLK